MVYLIDLGTCYKIGTTNNLKKRIETFKNSREIVIPIDVIVYPHNTINIENIDKKIESELHLLCKEYKISRELFQKIPNVIQIFQKYKIEKIKDLVDWKSQFDLILSSCEKTKIKEEKFEKTIYQYDLDGNFIREWNGVTQIERELGLENRGIYRAIQGIYNKSCGYIWSLKKLSEEELKDKVKKALKYNNYSKVLQYSKDNVLLKQYNSITEASEETGISISSISLCCKGRYKTAGSYIWKKEG